MKAAKARLDQLLVREGHFLSREQARRAVMAGIVEVDGHRVDKPGTPTPEDAVLVVKGAREPFVSRAGRKLDGALEHFLPEHPELDPDGAVCLDVGASTGGFTDCLLQRGARRVYAVDVGYGQLDHGLREDPRVVVMERRNARYLKPGDIPEECRIITLDLSFISLAKVVPALLPFLAPGGYLLPMIKPQFEAGRRQVGKGGIVRDEEVRSRVVEETIEALLAADPILELLGSADSEVAGVGGNREAFALFRRAGSPGGGKDAIEDGKGAPA